jgi:hypothetical protein
MTKAAPPIATREDETTPDSEDQQIPIMNCLRDTI